MDIPTHINYISLEPSLWAKSICVVAVNLFIFVYSPIVHTDNCTWRKIVSPDIRASRRYDTREIHPYRRMYS